MSGFFSKLFGGGKKTKTGGSDVENLVSSTVEGLIEKSGFELSFEVETGKDDQGEPQIVIEFTGADEDILKDKEGQMIDAIQLFLKRVIQHHFPEDRTNIVIDCNGYREESSQALIDLAEKLKGIALEKGKSVYFRALPPKDRKIIHQHLAGDERVKSRSIGDGLYKKIKIYPTKAQSNQSHGQNEAPEESID
jgi:spoIIIJ-associated protein